MASYKVITLSVGGLNNKIYRYGEEVTEQAFGEKRIPFLIKGGYIVEVEAKEVDTRTEEDLINEAIAKVEAAEKEAAKPASKL